MSNTQESYILVRNQVESPGISIITGVIRSYENRNRAEEDVDLLSDADSTGIYTIVTVPHIER